jgi:tRNA-specific 2-thiouridylase
MKRVVLGVSGGVDSSVAGYLLKQEGYDVIGLFMRNWEETDGGACTAAEDYEDAKSVCLKLKIPFYSVNFSKEYWDNVFTHFLEEYKKGRTPNPDILCNSEIKFKCFLEYAKNNMDCDYIATGHYAQNETAAGVTHLYKAADAHKDQTYFLSFLTAAQIASALFPIGSLQKSEVREIAARLNLRTAAKKDSTGICFIGERNFKNFLMSYLPAKEGDIVDAGTGAVIGRHNGLMYYTIGQRRGLGIGHIREGERWFVCGKNLDDNLLYAAEGADNPLLFKAGFYAREIHLINPVKEPEIACTVKYRYQQQEKPCRVFFENGGLKCLFDERQSGVAPGQAGVFYLGRECLGGAVIDETF